MTIRSRTTAIAFASLLAIAAAPLAARAADTPLPGQPGADTTAGQELRGAPYIVMMVTSSGMTTERQITASTAAEMMKHAKPLTGMVVLMHEGKAYVVDNMPMKNGKMLYDSLTVPESLIFN
jgi:hypothetical protein